MSSTLAALKDRTSQTALINQQGKQLSYEEFYDFTTKCSYLLNDKGLNKNSKVLILAPLDWPLYTLIASCIQLGATIVLVDPWANSDYIEKALSQVNPEFLILSKKAKIFLLKKSIRKIPNRIEMEDLIFSSCPERYEEITEVEDDHSALITFTSGTTGIPKGFDRSHKFLLEQQKAHEKYFNHHPSDIDLSMYPVFVLSNLKTGLTSVLIKGNLRKIDTINAADLYNQIREHNVNTICLSPIITEKLVKYCEDNKLTINLKTLLTGGAPVHPELCKRIMAAGITKNAYVVYGSTEVEPISLMPMEKISFEYEDLKLGTPLGNIVDALKSKLHTIENVHPYHSGEIGELTLTGDFVGKRYWNNEAAFKENKWVDEENHIWHNTGDIVSKVSNSYFMLGRKSNGIKTSKGTLYPVPVENQIDQISGIKKSSYLQIGDNVILAFEGKDTCKRSIQDFFTHQDLPLDKIIHMKEIPRDSRHRTKIDLPKLKEYIRDKKMLAISKNSPLSTRLLAYTKERFPLIPIMLFVFLLTTGYGHFITHWFGHDFSWQNPKLWPSMICIFLFMLQLRMADEIKDFKKDSIAYPERILSQGIIPLSVIKTILFLTITTQIIVSFTMGIPHGMWMIVMQVWALLMAKEFFFPSILEKSGLLNLVLHQLVLFPLAIYAALPSIAYKVNILQLSLIAPLLYLTLHYTLYEIGRKTWSSDRENVHADSYTRFWGIKGAVGSQVFLIILNLSLMHNFKLELAMAYKLSAYFLSLFYVVILFGFMKNPSRKMSKLVEAAGSVFLLGMCALNAFLLT